MSKKTKQLFLVLFFTLISFALVFWYWQKTDLESKIQEASPEQGPLVSVVIVSPAEQVKAQRATTLKKVSQKTKPKTAILVLADQADHVLKEITTIFPGAKITPLMIKKDTPEKEIGNLLDKLNNLCRQECLLVVALNFSSGQSSALAEIHDSFSIRALLSLDEESILKSETESPETLLLAILWAKKQETQKFHLEENTNSGKLSNNPDAETTSFVFGWYERGSKEEVVEEATFMFAGDMMFDRFVHYKFRDDLKESMKNLGERFFRGTDVSIVNLEGPIGATPTVIDTNPYNLIFNFPPETTNVLKWLHLDAVSLANNHTLNAGPSGLENTKAVLSKAGIVVIGEPNKISEDTVRRFPSGGKNISIIAVNALEGSLDLSQIITQEKNTGAYIIVFPHWGNEYQKTHSKTQESLAHAWIDAGTDLVIGSHPHVIQDAELYQGKPIFYSLGNLLFDQFFSEETQEGLVVAGRVTNDKLTLLLLPIKINNLQPELMGGEERKEIINRLKQNLGADISQNGYGYDIVEIKR